MNKIIGKVIAIVVLGILICAGLIFLYFNRPFKKETIIVETPMPTPTPSLPTPEPSAEPIVEEVKIDITSDSSINRLVNKNNMVSESYVPELVSLNVSNDDNQQLRPEAAAQLEEMFNAAKEVGINLNVVSGYRSYKQQKSLWYTYEEKYGRKVANRMDATPGASEHQLGLAVDLSANDGCKLKQCFGSGKAGKWLSENSYKYGFIMRYPKGKESITGVMYNPWHYRFIGIEEAKKVFESNLTLEEFYK